MATNETTKETPQWPFPDKKTFEDIGVEPT